MYCFAFYNKSIYFWLGSTIFNEPIWCLFLISFFYYFTKIIHDNEINIQNFFYCWSNAWRLFAAKAITLILLPIIILISLFRINKIFSKRKSHRHFIIYFFNYDFFYQAIFNILSLYWRILYFPFLMVFLNHHFMMHHLISKTQYGVMVLVGICFIKSHLIPQNIQRPQLVELVFTYYYYQYQQLLS